MKKRILIVGGILVAAGVAGAVGWYYLRGSTGGAADGDVVYVTAVSTLTGASSGNSNRYAGVVEPQETVEVKIDSGRKVKEVKVKTGDEVKQGQLLFEYDLSSIQEDLQQAKLDLDRLKNEALSLADQIATYEAEKKKASADSQLSYTIEIETNRMNLKKNEYDQKSKEAQIQKLQNATGNTEVRSEIDGVIQKIDSSKLSTDDGDSLNEGLGEDAYGGSGDNTSNAFITILSTGAYRVKGKVNELNAQSIIPGEPVIIRSRVDENQTWRGTMGEIDRNSSNSENNNNSMMMYGMMDTGDSQTTSSTYPFYVELDSSDGLMLGQHVYIERDEGQADKEGLWLSDFFIVDVDEPDPYVWAAGDNERLEKRSITLGNYDAELGEYEIVDGLTVKDMIAFPTESLAEGLPTAEGTAMQSQDMLYNNGDAGIDMEQGGEPDMIEEPINEEDLSNDFSGEDLVPIDGVGFAEDVEGVG
ncbi:MAG: efflux RND transporter periplasmic adaptor subunit [Eubacteriales bacterium]|nr:efflux RND transporter periplasmic adaptor subunit [Eubacteriales bacterium]